MHKLKPAQAFPLNWMFVAAAAVFYVQTAVPALNVTWIAAALLGIVVLGAFLFAEGMSRWIGLVLFLAGAAILGYNGSPLIAWEQALLQNFALVALVMFVPMLSIPINIGGYKTEIETWIDKYSHRPVPLFLVSSSSFLFLGPLLNIGSIHIIDSILKKWNLPAAFKGRAYVRGVTTIFTWSPYFSTMAFMLFMLDITLAELVPWGFALGMVNFVAGCLLYVLYVKDKRTERISIAASGSAEFEGAANRKRKYGHLIAVYVVLAVAVFALDQYTDWNMTVAISLMTVGFAAVWSVLIKRGAAFLQQAHRYIDDIVPKRASEILLFITAGFFGAAAASTPIGDIVEHTLVAVSQVSTMMLILLIMTAVPLFAILGFHPIILASIIIVTVSPESLHISPVLMCLLLLSSWSLANVISPLTPINLMVAGLSGISAAKVVRMNLGYAGITFISNTVVLYLFHRMIGP